MDKSEKKIITIIALVILICIAGVTAVSFMYEPSDRGDKKHRTTVSQTVSDAANITSSDKAVTDSGSTAPAGTKESTSAEKTTAPNQKASITLDEAKSIALKDSGKDEGSVTFKKQKLDRDNGIYEYEIEFHDGVTEYEYDINAQTGDIISRSSEPYDYD